MEMDETSVRIRELLASGKPLHITRQEPTTKEERKVLQRAGYSQMGLYLILGVCIVGVPFLANEDELSKNYQYGIAAGLLLAYGTLLVLVFVRMRQAYAKSKNVITGFITAKSREPMKQGYAHFITLGKDQIIRIDTGSWHRYAIGDAVECHVFSNWGTVVLSHKPVEFKLPD
jgi:hypothetical protein